MLSFCSIGMSAFGRDIEVAQTQHQPLGFYSHNYQPLDLLEEKEDVRQPPAERQKKQRQIPMVLSCLRKLCTCPVYPFNRFMKSVIPASCGR
uniref:Uncharacterized protein n=1 Tax=Leptobrachium leishanense TaxID=445787 RepID=A0A8C5QLQ6_9ANUR